MSKIGVDELFGGTRCSLRTAKDRSGYWYVEANGRPVAAFKKKPTKTQLNKLRREVCG
jgi:hypothetical protein